MSVFDWCSTGKHDKCTTEFERFIIDPKTNKPIMLGETITCQCLKRGCKCYVKPADRKKTTKRKRKQ